MTVRTKPKRVFEHGTYEMVLLVEMVGFQPMWKLGTKRKETRVAMNVNMEHAQTLKHSTHKNPNSIENSPPMSDETPTKKSGGTSQKVAVLLVSLIEKKGRTKKKKKKPKKKRGKNGPFAKLQPAGAVAPQGAAAAAPPPAALPPANRSVTASDPNFEDETSEIP